MKKFVYFLMVVLTFTVFQVATVGADEVDISHCAQFEGEPKVACEAAAHVKSAPQEKSYRNELSEKNRMRNGIPGSGRKMK